MARKKAAPPSRRPSRRPKADPEHAGAHPALAFPVVAIGASAGGLAAFTALLKALPAKTGMAYVLIQHLEPSHESALAALLSKVTRMPVLEVTDGIPVEPDRVYVIPPNRSMTVRKGVLRLAPRTGAPGMQRPIDDFAIALAEEQGAAAVGVVLSGTGSDGTYGLKAIKAAGGVTFAQEPKTAQWPAMPTSAITAGAADFIQAPRRIAAELAHIGRNPYLAGAREAAGIEEGSTLDKVCLILRTFTGVDFRLYKQATVRRRIARRMALQKIASLNKYAQILKRSPQEAQALADDIFIHVTSFFRDPKCFQALRKRVLAKLGQRRAGDDPIRIWVAGCSTGEEVYSLAMLILETLGDRTGKPGIQIFGTDIQERALEHARAGIYSGATLAGVSPARLKRFFNETESGYQIRKPVRDLCVFARHDLAKDPPFSRLDLISCRNVLIYMGAALQRRVLSIFQYALKPTGFLFLGNSESISDYSDAFAPEDSKHRIFARKPGAAGFRDAQPQPAVLRGPEGAPGKTPPTPGAPDFRKQAETALLEHYTPPALIVDPDLRIVHFQGDTSPYLAPATGQPSFHLLKMVRPEFVVDLRAAVDKAKKQGVAVHRDQVQFVHLGKPAAVRLEVRPVASGNGRKRNFLVVFQSVEPAAAEEPARRTKAARRGRGTEEKASRLERDLASTRDDLRRLIEEHETAQEEMKAANEEILSSNEELQSTNEELETAKEELQSSNEELITLNEELQHRNTELNVLTQDLGNLLVGVDIAVLVLDAELRVRRFTPVAGSLLNLIPGDVGRPFSQIASTLNVADWKGLFREVTKQEHLVEREVADRSGHRYTMRVRPYKTSDNRIEGVLLVMMDADAIYRARDAAMTAEARSDSILNSMTAHIAVLDAGGTIVSTNEAWNRFAAANQGHTGAARMKTAASGANYLEVCRHAAAEGVAEAQAAREGIEAVLAGRSESFSMEYPCHSPTEERWFLMNVSPLRVGSAAPYGAVVSHMDITVRKLAELEAARSEFTIRSLLQSTSQSVIAVNVDEKIVIANGNTEKMFGYKPEELIGQQLGRLLPEAARAKHAGYHKAYFAHMQTRPMGIGLNLQGRRKDGTVFPVEIGLSGIDRPEGKLAVAFVSDITQRRQLEQAAAAHAEEARALAASLLTAQEEERRRVSRELHDRICQQLASLAIDIGGLAAGPPPPDNAKRLRDLQARVIEASEETRHIAYEMHPSVLDDLGLTASVRDLCRRFSERVPEMELKLDIGALPAAIPRETASCVYRIAEEALRNIVKHSRATRVSLSLGLKKGAIALTVADNGRGFDPEAARGGGGLGLVSMRERARLAGGRLSVETRRGPGRGHGTRIAIELSLPPGSL